MGHLSRDKGPPTCVTFLSLAPVGVLRSLALFCIKALFVSMRIQAGSKGGTERGLHNSPDCAAPAKEQSRATVIRGVFAP